MVATQGQDDPCYNTIVNIIIMFVDVKSDFM